MLSIRIIRTPPVTSIDGIQLDRFEQGCEYEVGNTVGALLLAEGWAEPLTVEESALAEAPTEPVAPNRGSDASDPPNLSRERFPPDHELLRSVAAHRRHRG
jgi:hypothetical protein